MLVVVDVRVHAVSSATPITTAASTLLVKLEHRHERLLRDLHRPHALHPLLAFLLLLQKLALARHVSAIALGEHVLAHGRHGLARDHLAADGGLDRDLVELAGDYRLELLDKFAALGLGLAAM